MANIEFMYFDLGNVILPFDHDLMCRQVAAVADIEPGLVRALLLEGEIQANYESGAITSQQFFECFCELTNSTPDQDALMVALSDIFELNAHIIPILTQLNAVNFPIGLLSNTCEAHWNFILDRFQIVPRFFETKILSYQVKCLKPNAQIYELAAEAAGFPAEKIFFVDDKPENVEGAKNSGFVAVQFENPPCLTRALQSHGLRINL